MKKKEIHISENSGEERSPFLEERERMVSALLKKIMKEERRITHLQSQEELCKKWQEVEKEGILLQANLYRIHKGQHSIEVEDWEEGGTKTLTLMGKTKEESLKYFFKKARKLKRGLPLVQKKIEEGRNHLYLLEEEFKAIQKAPTIKELERYKKAPSHEQKKEKSPSKKPYHIYYSSTGYSILVGKSQKDNDLLTFKIGEPHDIWIHTRDFPGSHVLIKAKRNEEPDQNTLEEAAQLAIASSKAQNEPRVDVLITRQKYVKRIKGKPGQVIVSEKKIRKIFVDKKKLFLIKERTNPLL